MLASIDVATLKNMAVVTLGGSDFVECVKEEELHLFVHAEILLLSKSLKLTWRGLWRKVMMRMNDQELFTLVNDGMGSRER